MPKTTLFCIFCENFEKFCFFEQKNSRMQKPLLLYDVNLQKIPKITKMKKVTKSAKKSHLDCFSIKKVIFAHFAKKSCKSNFFIFWRGVKNFANSQKNFCNSCKNFFRARARNFCFFRKCHF